ncbi:MAG TPA: hypothetical protein VN380_02190 [Thermoanaerobaculia bacterium]|nr:hypothetical protein [Thermoanaerobaculia bacterium]
MQTQGRFAGAYFNPGYFFSLTEMACVVEMHHYHRVPAAATASFTVQNVLTTLANNRNERVFLTCEGSFENVLNLFWPATLRRTIAECFPTIDTQYIDYPSVLLSLADSTCGGNWMTDAIGRYAYEHGYNGVRFPSVRALHAERNRPWAAGSLMDGLRYGPIGDDESFYLDDLMQEIHSEATNVVIFRGSYILRNVTRFRIATVAESAAQWHENEWWLNDEAAIEGAIMAAGGSMGTDLRAMCTRDIDASERSFDHWYV